MELDVTHWKLSLRLIILDIRHILIMAINKLKKGASLLIQPYFLTQNCYVVMLLVQSKLRIEEKEFSRDPSSSPTSET